MKFEVLLGFENFQLIAHGFLGCQFLGKCRVFHFGKFLMHQRNFQGILQCLHMLFLDTSQRIRSEYI